VLHVVYFEPQVNSSTIQDLHFPVLKYLRSNCDLKLSFPGLSRTKLIFQDFPGPGKSSGKIQDFPGCMGTLSVSDCKSLNYSAQTLKAIRFVGSFS